MSNIKNFAGWRAGQIAKLALLNGGFNEVYESANNQEADFVAVSGATGNRQYLVEVKASKTPKRALSQVVKQMRARLSPRQPFMAVVVDSEVGEGLFKVIDNGKESEALPLKKNEIEKISGSTAHF